MNHRAFSSVFSLSLTLLFFSLLARAEDGVSATEIRLGMSNAQSGPASALGTGMKKGAEAFFRKLNAEGGIHGRKVSLVSHDDGYEPDRAVANTEKLIQQDKVFSLFGYVGTPTSTAVLPLVGKSDIPYVAPFTGAEFLREPLNKNVFNVRASYFDETETLVDYLFNTLKLKKIATFVQDDSYGAAGNSGVVKALRKRDSAPVAKGTYTRNTVDVDAGLEEIKKAAPEAVIMVGTYKACAAFVKKAKSSGFNPKFLNVSFVGTAALIKELGADGEGVIISQVTPLYTDASVPVVKQYQADMKAAGASELDYTSLEGYIGAKVLSEALKKAGKELTRDGLRSALSSLKMDLGGFTVGFSPTDHGGSKQVFLTRIQGQKPVMIGK